ncbi:MAG: hypothetical protein IPK83_10895 [Planctomycetes bacterium]|nr:hypothetical protein [Planctomycetota bacterium]
MKENTWYRMKLVVSINGSKADVQGKIWPREEKEPSDWTIQFEDPCPNLEGCPGLFAYSNGTTDKSNGPEIFFDNLIIRKN